MIKSVATQIIVIMYRRRRGNTVRRTVVVRRSGGLRSATAGVRLQNHRTALSARRGGTLAQQVRSLQRVVKKNAPEIKYHSPNVDAVNIPNTGTVVALTQIAQGDTVSTRTGNTINVTSVRVAGFFNRAVTDPAIDALCRIAIVVDKQQIADTDPTAAAIFTSPNEPVGAFVNVDFMERFSILHLSKVYSSSMMKLDTDIVAVPTQLTSFEWNWKGNLKVSFNGTTAADIQKNCMYVVFLSNDTTLDFDGAARVGFTDV